jgi:hypothetical protein
MKVTNFYEFGQFDIIYQFSYDCSGLEPLLKFNHTCRIPFERLF